MAAECVTDLETNENGHVRIKSRAGREMMNAPDAANEDSSLGGCFVPVSERRDRQGVVADPCRDRRRSALLWAHLDGSVSRTGRDHSAPRRDSWREMTER